MARVKIVLDMNSGFPKKTALAVVTFIVLVMAPEALPALKNYRSLDFARIATLLDFPLPKPAVAPELAAESLVNQVSQRAMPATVAAGAPSSLPSSLPAPTPTQILPPANPKKLFDPSGEMNKFFAALDRGEGVHILHYGDSPTTADLITADARLLFQKRFGDGGLGFTLVAKPWAWYNHRGIDMSASSDWIIDIGLQSLIRDGRNGLGAVSFRGRKGARASWKLRDRNHSYVEVAYISETADGEFTFDADGKPIGMATTSGDPGTPPGTPGFARFEIPSGAREFGLRVTRGTVRLFGVDFRKNVPGVVYSSLGVNGANVTLLSKALDQKHWSAQLQHYRPALVIINYGTNESGFSDFVDTTWAGELRRVIARVRSALPDTSILLMSPMDRGDKDGAGDIVTLAALPRLVSTEQRVAMEEHVAFFNTFEAMGGAGTMARWYAAEPRLVGSDFIHPMPAGARIVGELLFAAIYGAFEQYKMQDSQFSSESKVPLAGGPNTGVPAVAIPAVVSPVSPAGAANKDDSGKGEFAPQSADGIGGAKAPVKEDPAH